MQAQHWELSFVPGARAVWPQARRLRTAPGDPPTSLDKPSPLASAVVGLYGNALALAATGSLLTGECLEVHGGTPRAVAHEASPVMSELALEVRQLVAQQAWRDMELRVNPAGEIDLWPLLEPWLSSLRDLPDGSRILPESMAPYWSINALLEGQMLRAEHAVPLARLLSASAPPVPQRAPSQQVRP